MHRLESRCLEVKAELLAVDGDVADNASIRLDQAVDVEFHGGPDFAKAGPMVELTRGSGVG